MKSMLAMPLAVVGFNRTVWLPAFRLRFTVTVVQVVHAPVPAKAWVLIVEPFTMICVVRATVVPLAKRTAMLEAPLAGAVTVHCTPAPTALVPLQNPLPENPACSFSIAPVHEPDSASYLTVAAWAACPDSATM